ncbi:hypothetical protein HYDPIDRAFT_29556 [Hydnomerulius pinastri MD-312]|uniref:Unplaced genomic scaffold scaffold_17, whole genome shotgun sequence n=1 Tax=Hydnomerulius pinastri MD-312 TaxID=994086 RepID=A0A0C9W7Q7_9AGAM|nr:hypothetical protein HYDPIDRAFT_29556 [Hydnomerulius pinastri MD-312]
MLRLARNGPASFALLAVALVTGLLGGFVLSSSGSKADLCPLPFDTLSPTSGHDYPISSHAPISSGSSHYSESLLLDNDELDLEALRTLVAGTRGYYARDYSMALGWNNMRYIIETSLYHGLLLNRTVIIPSFVYARSCEYDNSVCAAYAPMVNRGDAVSSDEWRQLPEEQQMAWRVPMSVMLNMTHLRRSQPVITVAEYLRLHNLPEDLELSTGQWDKEKYHQSPSAFNLHGKPPSIHVVENWWYDPQGLNRVDSIPEEMKARGWDTRLGDRGKDENGGWKSLTKTKAYHVLEAALSGRQYVLGWDQARQILQSNGIGGVTSDEGLTQVLNDNGWEVLYTFDGALGMDYVKNVVNPIRQVAPRDSIRGYAEDYYRFTEDVLLLKGEIHYERKPGGLRFTSTAARDVFARLVLFEIHPTDRVKELADTMDLHMRELVGGRMWMGAHMRRGDFVRYNWVMQAEFGDHLQRIKNHLDDGRRALHSINPESLGTYAVPDVTANHALMQLKPPNEGDKIYIATDERDPVNLAYLTEHGVIRAPDLITIEDRRRFGWPLLLTDVLGVVEQDLLARGSFFYAHALSSVAGGVVNIRAANGADPRTAQID